MEIDYGRFTRQIALPADIDVEASKATYDRGVLTIVLPLAKKPVSDRTRRDPHQERHMTDLMDEQIDIDDLDCRHSCPSCP